MSRKKEGKMGVRNEGGCHGCQVRGRMKWASLSVAREGCGRRKVVVWRVGDEVVGSGGSIWGC